MTTAEGNNAVVAHQLEALANAAKNYTAALIAQAGSSGGSSSGNVGVLDTVPATVDGGLWYEMSDGVQVLLKLFKDNKTYSLPFAKGTQASSASQYLSVWLRFNQSAIYDECGHTFTAVGSPTIGADYAISGNALQLQNANDYIQRTDGISLGGRDFTVDCRFRCTNSAPYYTEVFLFANETNDTSTRFCFALLSAQSISFALGGWQSQLSGENWQKAIGSLIEDDKDFRNKIFHCALVYRHDEQKVYGYLNGKCFCVASTTLFQSARTYPLLKIGSGNSSNTPFTGTIDEFRVHDGIALWTENFTPPTASDYL